MSKRQKPRAERDSKSGGSGPKARGRSDTRRDSGGSKSAEELGRGERTSESRGQKPGGGGKRFYRKGKGRNRADESASGTDKGASGLSFPVRLNRFIARSGVCSRREADELISSGSVRVNGTAVKDLGTKVEEADRVEVNGKLISPRSAKYLLLNKPTDTITTTDDDRGRTTVLDLIDLPDAQKAGLFPVGRLDRDTSGVLIITSDGDLAHRLMHPSYEIEKVYRIKTRKPISREELMRLADGIELEDGLASADQVAFLDPDDPRIIALSIHEGRNRQVRRMLEGLGHDIVTLSRVRYASLSTKGVRRGKWRRLDEREISRLYRLVKLKG